jgi:hypothetical protein
VRPGCQPRTKKVRIISIWGNRAAGGRLNSACPARPKKQNMSGTKTLLLLIILAICSWGPTVLAAEHGKLAFVRGGNIWISDSIGANPRQLTYSLRDRSPAVSPDGKWVAYQSWPVEGSDSGQIFMIPAAGGMVQQFRHPEVQGAAQPCFSPGGKQLLFVGLSDFQAGKSRGSEYGFATESLCLADLASGTVRRIISHPNTNLDTGYIYNHPAFSGNGRRIAYEQANGFSVGFVVIDRHGKRLYRFPKRTREAASYLRPQFSPDGKEILCYSPDVDKNKDVIYLINLASGKQTPLALGGKPTYVDHGKAIVYQRWPLRGRTSEKIPVKATALRRPQLPPNPEMVRPDLWRLELKPGGIPRMIIAGAAEPAGQMR